MELIERIQQLERELKALRPDLHFPSTATVEHRLRWLEIVLEETRARDNHGIYAETPSEEKLRQLLAHTVYIKQDRITLHSLTADPGSVVAGDMWFRSDLGKDKLAVDAVVANAKLLRREGDVIATAEVPSLDAAKITSGRFGVARMPDGTSGQVLTAQGGGVDPAYASVGVPALTFVADDSLRNSNDTEKHTLSGGLIRLKETKLNAALPACRIRFDARSSEGSEIQVRIYKNGAAIGTAWWNYSSIYVTYSEDFAGFAVNDLIQVYQVAGYDSYIRNFRFYYSKSITAFGSDVLTTPLSTTNAISMTNQDP